MSEVQHPFLADPDRARAYRILCDLPTGTTRSWAEQIGWTHSRLVRFLNALKDRGLADVETHGKYGSSFRSVSDRSVPFRIVPHRSGLYLDKRSGSTTTASRCADPAKEPKIDEERLIVAFNEVMEYRFAEHYRPISLDNRGSLKAAKTILDAGVPLEEAIVLLKRQAMAYEQDKTGGDLPHSLGHKFLARAVINKWQLLERERQQLPLLPQVDFQVERSSPTPKTVVADETPHAPIDPETLAAVKAELAAKLGRSAG